MKKVIFIVSLIFVCSCGGSDDSKSENSEDIFPTKPKLVYPINNTECSNADLLFDWNPSSDSEGSFINYKLYISTSATFDSNIDIYEASSSTDYNIDLPQSTALYWKVEASNQTNSSFSETWSLYTQGDGVANTIPQLEYLGPRKNEVIDSSSITLKWQGIDVETNADNLRYIVYFSKAGEALERQNDADNKTGFFVDNLVSGNTYLWYTQVTDESGATNVGEIFSFTVN